MCGIIAYIGKRELPLELFLEAMAQMEILKEEVDRSPLGGHGSGILCRLENSILLEKNCFQEEHDKPAARLLKQLIKRGMEKEKSNLVIVHVRRAADKNKTRIKDKKYSQPYVTNCLGGRGVAVVHNGYVSNYREIAEEFFLKHSFESEDPPPESIIDSEILPHLYEELVNRGENPLKMLEYTKFSPEGGNTYLVVDLDRGKAYLYHQGKTRGILYYRSKSEILITSRRKPVERLLETIGFLDKPELEILPQTPFKLALQLPVDINTM